MKHKVLIFFFRVLPKGFISRIFGFLARLSLPGFMLRFFIGCYCGIYKVNRDEISYPDGGFKSMDHFFTRKLKEGVHKTDSGENSVVSPVDAMIYGFGKIDRDRIIQAKGIEYTIRDLIPSETADEFIDGSFITLYLSPADYHRIHSPAGGKITGYFHIPGKLFPVQDFMVYGIDKLFAKNERMLSYIKSDKGLLAVCKIGAMNVGRITLSYTDVETNRFGRKQIEFFYSRGSEPRIKKGEEIGIFHFGSTIILLFRKGMIRIGKLNIGQKVRVGQRIASYI